MRGKRLDVKPGDSYGRLVIVQEEASRDGRRHFLCTCQCGVTKTIRLESLRSGAIQSCGCYNREISRKVNTKHGMYKSRIYGIWTGMKGRCFNQSNTEYAHYGGRGITICPEWMSFPAFCRWAMQNGYSDDLTIERVDNNGNYEPGNCAWISEAEQRRNTTRVQKVALNDRRKTLRQWAKDAGMNFSTLMHRIRAGMTLEQALAAPVRSRSEQL